jgi:hypothetical protein
MFRGLFVFFVFFLVIIWLHLSSLNCTFLGFPQNPVLPAPGPSSVSGSCRLHFMTLELIRERHGWKKRRGPGWTREMGSLHQAYQRAWILGWH